MSLKHSLNGKPVGTFQPKKHEKTKPSSSHYGVNLVWLMPIVVTAMVVGFALLFWMMANMITDGAGAANITIIIIGVCLFAAGLTWVILLKTKFKVPNVLIRKEGKE